MIRQFISLSTLAVCLGYSIALIPGNTSPLIVGGLIAGLDLGVADSGMVFSFELILIIISLLWWIASHAQPDPGAG